MTRKEEQNLIKDIELIKKRLLGDKISNTPSLIDDVEQLKKKTTIKGFLLTLVGKM